MTQDLLIELGVEEIPSGFLVPALDKWREAALRLLDESRLGHGKSEILGTPRRMVLAVDGVEERQADAVEERTGPFVAQAFDGQGKPTRAGDGFARSCGVEVNSLERQPTPKGDKLVFRKSVAGRPALEILAEKIPDLIRAIPFPKTMRWGSGELRFVRPIHWILALFGDQVVPFSLDGIQSGRITRGHRFTHPGAVEVRDRADYMEAMDRAGVVVDPGLRREVIERDIARLAEEFGGEVIPDPELMEEVSWLVEFPVAVAGRFEEKFLKVPAEVLIEAMRSHQKYFALQKKGSNRELKPCFITVANTPAPDLGVVAKGNERVLRARLSDAEFFFREDGKVSLEQFAERLSGVVFQAKLGSYAEKSGRVAKLAEWLAGELAPGNNQVKEDAVRAARLCKADLVTQMVYEFPTLQGIMGGEYARISGERPEVAQAVREHYLPRSAEDIEKGILPASAAGAIVSLADKMDAIVGCWGVGLAPTGSQDAFAIRRQTLGIISILRVKNYRLSVQELIKIALNGVQQKITRKSEEVQKEVIEFFKDRVRNLMIENPLKPYPYDVVDAILAVWEGDLVDMWQRVKALSDLKEREDFEPLMIAFKRVVRIIEASRSGGVVDQGRFEHETEKLLYREFKKVEGTARPLIQEKRYAEALSELAKLKPAVDKFFDDVMVNVEDEKLRGNRHALLAEISRMFQEFADFSKVVTAG